MTTAKPKPVQGITLPKGWRWSGANELAIHHTPGQTVAYDGELWIVDRIGDDMVLRPHGRKASAEDRGYLRLSRHAKLEVINQ